MKDAKGHGSAAHQHGVEVVGRSPMGNPMPQMRPEDSSFLPNRAYQQGHNAYYSGKPESSNPHSDPHLASEWIRAFKVHRKQDKFNATIAKRQAAKGGQL